MEGEPAPCLSVVQPSRAAAFDQLFVSYFIESFDQTRHVGSPGGRSAHWLDRLPAFLAASDSAPKFAIRAASMLSYGTAATDISIKADAYVWYARALPALRAVLARGKPPVMDGAVCAAVMLMHFETWAKSSDKAWVPHVKGVCTMLGAAGPHSCRVGFLHNVFCHVRLQACVEAMSENILHPFASPEWMTTPFELVPKTFFDELVDLLFLVQKCLARADQLMRNGVNDCTMDKALHSWIHGAMSLQYAWLQRYVSTIQMSERRLPGMPQSTTSLSTCPEHLDITYTTVSAAALISLYHTVNLLLLRLLQPQQEYIVRIQRHAEAILSANDFVLSAPGPSAEFGPVMMLLQLKVASLWGAPSAERIAAESALQRHRMRYGGLMSVFDTEGGYFADLAAWVLSNATASSCAS
ncbi:Zn(2)-C6 fungal-type DNA-binding domain-containingprotein [Purpureocillium lilacinum]|uniref:Zn(2)-C6 fungal-type DNA-binding domain-containingprotein n=1 Tax=Purpureocillium lilacinum TaxID=33203 RepID=A0A179GFE1_PURLI|nr:Zn(2)-C6 fungal-type DNA-binding domain-containingprotein [Purpureocillium lilacinum]